MPLLLRATVVTCLAALVTTGGALTPAFAAYDDRPGFSWVPNGRVYALAMADGVVYLGGTFSSLYNPVTGVRVTRTRLAAVDAASGELITGWNPGANNTVRSLDVGPNGVVYVGGDFTAAAGRTATRVAAIQASGAAVSGRSASANNTVRQIYAGSEGVYIAGNFSSVNGARRIGIARLSLSSGALATSWNARVTGGRVRALAPSPNGTDLILGGSFTALSGESRVFAGAVSRASGAVTAWTPPSVCGTCQVLDFAAVGGIAYGAVGGGGGGRAAAWSLSSGARLWVRLGDGDVQAVGVHDGVAYFGGHFGPGFLGAERHQFVALNATTGTLLDYKLEFTGSDAPGIWDILADSSGLRIAGGFQFANAPAARYAVLHPQ
jgi:hypothetical protein